MSASPSPIPFPAAPARPSLADGGIPVPPTPLLGRDRELREVAALLDRDDLRVVTLLGPGGVGKTRLALETAGGLQGMFADGALMVPLETIRDASLVPEAIARGFGIRRSPRTAIDELLIGHLAGRHLLLVLDNLEQVIDAGPWLAGLLARCRRLRVLATSRRPLGIAGEQRYPVDPLPVPDDADPRTAAVALFIERARALDPAFEPDPKTIAVIAEICRRLDGLPLAIELAAARTSALSPEALLVRLTHRLSLLSTGHPEAPARLRSMRDAVGWSYGLLTPEAQRLFRRLSVFLGGFALDAVAFVATWPAPPGSGVEGLHALQPLLDQSLVLPLREAGEPRFRMLETIREFGRQADAGDDAERAHAEYFVALTEPAPRALMGPDQVAWLDRLDAEYANIRAALDWLETHDRLADAVELATRIEFFVSIRGHTIDFRERVERWGASPALARPGRARGLALLALAGVLQDTGDLARSLELHIEAVSMLHDVGDRWFETRARDGLAGTYGFLDDDERMREVATGTLGTARQLGYHRSVCENLDYLATHALRSGNVAGSQQLKDEAFRVALEHGDTWVLAFHLRDEAAAAWHDGRLDDAEGIANEAGALFESLGSKRDVPGVWLVLALIAHDRGDLVTAAQRIATGSAIARAIGHHSWDVDWLQVAGGMIAAERGDAVAARESLAATLGHIDPDLQPLEAAQCLDAYALLAARAGDITAALRFRAASSRLVRETGVDLLQPGTHLMMKWVERVVGAALDEPVVTRASAGRDGVDVGAAMAEALAYNPANPPARAATPSFGLSRRELEVLRLMADGLSNQQVADALFVSLRTTATHVTSILSKLNLPSRTAAVAFAIRNGLA